MSNSIVPQEPRRLLQTRLAFLEEDNRRLHLELGRSAFLSLVRDGVLLVVGLVAIVVVLVAVVYRPATVVLPAPPAPAATAND